MRTAQLRIDKILAGEFSVRETRRIKAALMMAKLSAMATWWKTACVAR